MIPENLTALVGRSRRFLISSHANPDGDAIGSEIGLARLLRQAGKEAQIWNFHPTPATYNSATTTDGGSTRPRGPMSSTA